MDEPLTSHWERVTEWLRLARQRVRGEGNDFEACIAEFEKYLLYNELELALDALASAAEVQKQSYRFWDAMGQAAMQMQLKERQAEFAIRWAESVGVPATGPNEAAG